MNLFKALIAGLIGFLSILSGADAHAGRGYSKYEDHRVHFVYQGHGEVELLRAEFLSRDELSISILQVSVTLDAVDGDKSEAIRKAVRLDEIGGGHYLVNIVVTFEDSWEAQIFNYLVTHSSDLFIHFPSRMGEAREVIVANKYSPASHMGTAILDYPESSSGEYTRNRTRSYVLPGERIGADTFVSRNFWSYWYRPAN